MPPVEDIGPEELLVQFVFSVSDQHGGTVSGLTFNISVIPVDDQAPQVISGTLEPGLVVRVRCLRGLRRRLPCPGDHVSSSARLSPTCYAWRREERRL